MFIRSIQREKSTLKDYYFLYLSTIVFYGQNRFYTRFSTFPLFKCVLNITTNIVSHVLHIYVIVYIIYNIIPYYLKPNIAIFCTENGGESTYSPIIWYTYYSIHDYDCRYCILHTLRVFYLVDYHTRFIGEFSDGWPLRIQ
jgi:hypothetical protein